MTEERKNDRHKRKPLQIRPHPLLRQQLEELVKRNATDLATEVARAIREMLAREGLWPPPPPA